MRYASGAVAVPAEAIELLFAALCVLIYSDLDLQAIGQPDVSIFYEWLLLQPPIY